MSFENCLMHYKNSYVIFQKKKIAYINDSLNIENVFVRFLNIKNLIGIVTHL